MNLIFNPTTGESKSMNQMFATSFYKLGRNWDWGIISACVSAIISYTFGSTLLFWALFGIVIIDAITGIMAAMKKRTPICSDVFRWKTFVKLLGYFAILLVASTVDLCIEELGMTNHSLIHALALGWIVLVEGISVLENTEVLLGHKIPLLRRLRKILTDVEEETNVTETGNVNE